MRKCPNCKKEYRDSINNDNIDDIGLCLECEKAKGVNNT